MAKLGELWSPGRARLDGPCGQRLWKRIHEARQACTLAQSNHPRDVEFLCQYRPQGGYRNLSIGRSPSRKSNRIHGKLYFCLVLISFQEELTRSPFEEKTASDKLKELYSQQLLDGVKGDPSIATKNDLDQLARETQGDQVH